MKTKNKIQSGGCHYTDWRQIPSPVAAVKAAYESANAVQRGAIRRHFEALIKEHNKLINNR